MEVVEVWWVLEVWCEELLALEVEFEVKLLTQLSLICDIFLILALSLELLALVLHVLHFIYVKKEKKERNEREKEREKRKKNATYKNGEP